MQYKYCQSRQSLTDIDLIDFGGRDFCPFEINVTWKYLIWAGLWPGYLNHFAYITSAGLIPVLYSAPPVYPYWKWGWWDFNRGFSQLMLLNTMQLCAVLAVSPVSKMLFRLPFPFVLSPHPLAHPHTCRSFPYLNSPPSPSTPSVS